MDAQHGLAHKRVAVQPSVGGRGLDGGVLPRHLVGPHRAVADRRDVGQNVQVAQRGFDHDDVGPLGQVQRHLAHRLSPIGGVLLIRGPVPLQLGVDRITEWSVPSGGVLGGVGQDDDVVEPTGVQSRTHRRDLAVHHAAEADDRGPRTGLRHRHLGVAGQGGVVVHHAGVGEHTAVAMVGELVQAQVGHDQRATGCGRDCGGDGPVEDAVTVARLRSGCVAVGRDAEQHDATDPGTGRTVDRVRQRRQCVLHLSGHACDVTRLRERLGHEQRLHQGGRVESVLGHEPPHGGGLSQSAGPLHGHALRSPCVARRSGADWDATSPHRRPSLQLAGHRRARRGCGPEPRPSARRPTRRR